MDISIVIPTYNRLSSLKRVLTGLEKQDVPLSSFEVVVVSDGSTDGTEQFLAECDSPLNLQPVFQVNSGAAAARNTGIQTAVGDLIVFLDDDVVPGPQLLTEHMRLHEVQGDDVVVLGPMITPDDFEMAPWVQWEQAMLVKQYTAMIEGKWKPTPRQFYTGNTSLRRCHLLASGGFDTRFKRAEDVELAYRLADQGLRFLFNPQAVGYHYAERSFASWLSIPYAYGRNDVIFAGDKGQTWLLAAVWREYWARNVLVRALIRLCLDRPLLSRTMLKLLETVATVSYKQNLKSLAGQAYSGIFNMRYYQGVADQSGGRKALFAGAALMRVLRLSPLESDVEPVPARAAATER